MDTLNLVIERHNRLIKSGDSAIISRNLVENKKLIVRSNDLEMKYNLATALIIEKNLTKNDVILALKLFSECSCLKETDALIQAMQIVYEKHHYLSKQVIKAFRELIIKNIRALDLKYFPRALNLIGCFYELGVVFKKNIHSALLFYVISASYNYKLAERNIISLKMNYRI